MDTLRFTDTDTRTVCMTCGRSFAPAAGARDEHARIWHATGTGPTSITEYALRRLDEVTPTALSLGAGRMSMLFNFDDGAIALGNRVATAPIDDMHASLRDALHNGTGAEQTVATVIVDAAHAYAQVYGV